MSTLRNFPGGAVVKNLPRIQETQVPSLGWEDPLEKEMATHSSLLAWRIPWTQEPGGPQSMGPQESDTTERLNPLPQPAHVVASYKLWSLGLYV